MSLTKIKRIKLPTTNILGVAPSTGHTRLQDFLMRFQPDDEVGVILCETMTISVASGGKWLRRQE